MQDKEQQPILTRRQAERAQEETLNALKRLVALEQVADLIKPVLLSETAESTLHLHPEGLYILEHGKISPIYRRPVKATIELVQEYRLTTSDINKLIKMLQL